MNEQRITQQEWDRKIDAIKVCGANRGPHNWIPVRWKINEGSKHVTDLMCLVCYNRIGMETLTAYFPLLKM